MLAINLDRQTGHVSGDIGHEPLNLHLHAAIGEAKMVWEFRERWPADPEAIALALGQQLTDLSAGIVRNDAGAIVTCISIG